MALPTINGEQVYAAKVVEVRSGDDVVLMVDLGIDGLHKKVRARLHKVDTPDAYRADCATEAGKVREKVRSMVSAKDCRCVVHSQAKHGWIITLLVVNGNEPDKYLNVNEYLIDQGYVYRSNNEASA